ncbi:MAG: ferritin family protein [Nitrospiraceae bacterium]|nr:ferritin family protein [Nitrospiraceae bacterium]
MLTDKSGILDSLIEVYTMEKGTREFYRRAGENAHLEVSKEAFKELAKWEEGHMDYIRYLYQSITEDRELMSFEEFSKNIRPDTLEGGIPVRDVEKWLGEYSFIDELGAIIVALKMEARAYALYDELAKKTEDSSVRTLLRELKSWEEDHIKYLKELRLKIAETA